MPLSKAYTFAPDEYHFSIMCKALAHPARLKLLRNIAFSIEATFLQAAHGIPLSRPSILQHLRYLREMNVVLCEDKWPKTIYKINYDIPNTSIGLIQLAMRYDRKQNPEFVREIETVERRPGVWSD